MSVRLSLGAPGIYHLPESPLRALTGVRMDVCAFVGVAPRGPAREFVFTGHWQSDKTLLSLPAQARRTVAVAVESFDEYRRLFGGFEGPGLLPYAVASFFEQGGRRAYIARIVHEYNDASKNAAGVAVGQVPAVKSKSNEALILRARNEGSWGNSLRASLEFTAWPLLFVATHSDLNALAFEDESDAPVLGALLRLTLDDGQRVLRFVTKLEAQPLINGDIVWRASFDAVVIGTIYRAEQIEGELFIDDNDGRREQHARLGLSSAHPRWMAKILSYESELVYPATNWIEQEILPPDAALNPTGWSLAFGHPFDGLPIKDRYEAITADDFFDATWTRSNEVPGNGVHALTQLADLASMVVPDLYSPMPLAPLEIITDPISLAGAEFARCIIVEPKRDEQTKPQYDLAGLRLNPKLPAERALITALQQQLVDLADVLQSFVMLLDVPPGLTQRQMLQWRTAFNSSYAAAYHPWLQVARRDDSRDAIVRVPPSAAAAGIIARQELAFGIPNGPANVLAAEIIGLDDVVSSPRHDELHQQHLNVYLRERDGVRLTGARTLSRDPQWRQLSVRRLITMLRRALDQQMQWAVFEPNHRGLRAEIRILLNNYLRQLYRLGAFRGATEEQAFFVRCDETNNPTYITDAGRLIAEIGVAPAEPLEFIVLRLARDGDGTLTMKEK
jgi:uncharacterized protein